MKDIIKPIERELLNKELNDDTFVRNTNNGNREIYIIDAHNAPNAMLEIGRLREYSFRAAGGGTGEETDIDEFDTMSIPFRQLIVWDKDDQEIVGGYRFLEGHKFQIHNQIVHTPTAHLFRFNPEFVQHYLSKTIELGRSFVQPAFQPTVDIRKGMYSLDNLWDGLGFLTVNCPDIEYFFGKFTMYPHFNSEARDLIHYFLNKYFPDPDKLVEAHFPLGYKTNLTGFDEILASGVYADDYKALNTYVRDKGENIPPLVNAYMNLSPTMRNFGSAINDTFGDVEETGILIKIADIYDKKKERHIMHIDNVRKY